MHNGRSKDGRLLYPAFPYPNFTRVTREDSDAIYAYLRSVPPAATPNLAHKLRFPYDTQAALAVWRALSFTPGTFVPDPAQAGRMEPRRLPGRGPGPLHRLPRQRATCSAPPKRSSASRAG